MGTLDVSLVFIEITVDLMAYMKNGALVCNFVTTAVDLDTYISTAL
jgi:hypothetical protein